MQNSWSSSDLNEKLTDADAPMEQIILILDHRDCHILQVKVKPLHICRSWDKVFIDRTAMQAMLIGQYIIADEIICKTEFLFYLIVLAITDKPSPKTYTKNRVYA